MKIQIDKFTLEPSEHAKERFDLSKDVVREKINKDTRVKTGETYVSPTIIGYGMHLETCIERIIADRLFDQDKVVTLKEYVDAYKSEREQITNILK